VEKWGLSPDWKSEKKNGKEGRKYRLLFKIFWAGNKDGQEEKNFLLSVEPNTKEASAKKVGARS